MNASASSVDKTMQRILRWAASGEYKKAIDLLNSNAGRDVVFHNAKGVCLLRIGDFEEAIRVLRVLVFPPGCMRMRPYLPTVYLTNYAAALLLSGRVSGCLDILAEIRDADDPTVQRLRGAVRKWTAGLSLWQKFNWWIGRIAPANCPIGIDFEPGDFGYAPHESGTA